MTFSRSREKTERDSFANTKNRPCHSPTAEKNRGGGGCRKRRRALKKSPRALKSNTAGFEKKAAGFGSRHGGLCDETPQASGQGLGRSSPKAYPLPGAVSCTASTLHPFFATAACHHLKFPSKHLKHLGGRFTESLPVIRCACVISPKAYSLPDAACVVSPKACSLPGAAS